MISFVVMMGLYSIGTSTVSIGEMNSTWNNYSVPDGDVGSGSDMLSMSTAILVALLFTQFIPVENILSSDQESFSGKISYRPGKYLHQKLFQNSEKLGVSIYRLISDAVSAFLFNDPYQENEKAILEEIETIKTQILEHHNEINRSSVVKELKPGVTYSKTSNKRQAYSA